jgi:hypothetical protein
MFSDDVHQGRGHQELQAGQRLSRSRFVLKSELFRTSESSVYWLAEDRDEEREVTLYFLPEVICEDTSLLEAFLQRLNEWMDSIGESGHSIVHIDPYSKPYPFLALSTGSCDSLENCLLQQGSSSTWEDVEPLIEKVVQHLVQIHQSNQIHGRLSPENIRITATNEVVFVGPQIDRIALQILQEKNEAPLPKSWDLHASPECLESGNCQQADEVYSLASILLESIRHVGIHVALPRHVELQGKIRFGNLLVPKSIKQTLMDALDDNPANRPNTALRLSALLGFSVTDAVDIFEETSLDILAPDASERTRIFIRSFLRPKFLGMFVLMVALILGGWMIADWNQKRIAKKQTEARQVLNHSLALKVRDAAPSDLEGVRRQGSSTLVVTTSPEEALLRLSGPGVSEIKEEFAPATWHQLQEGAYQLSVLAVGYAPTNLYTFLESGKTNTVEISLSEPKTEIQLTTEPSGGTFRFQDLSGVWMTGLTPEKVFLPAGDYLVHFSLNGQNLTKPVRISRYQSKGIKLIATFGGCSLHLNSYPEKAEVYIGSELKGLTPLLLDGLASGEVELEIRKSGYLISKQSLILDSGKLNTMRVLLEKESIPAVDVFN